MGAFLDFQNALGQLLRIAAGRFQDTVRNTDLAGIVHRRRQFQQRGTLKEYVGDEIMAFHLGSTVVLLFEPGRVQLLHELERTGPAQRSMGCAPGPSANWIKSLGAVPVDGALPTYYNQIQTGVADGVVVIITGAFPNKHYEVAPYVTLVGLGAHMTGGLGVNKDIWESLSDDVRQVLSELGE